MARKRGRKPTSGRASTSTALSASDDGKVIHLNVGAVRELVRKAQTVEHGVRTPKATIRRWDRVEFSELTLPSVLSILDDARRGYPEDYADLTRRMALDPHVLAVRETRYAPVYSARYEVSPGEHSEAQAAAAIDLAHACEEALRSVRDLPAVMAKLLMDGEDVFAGVAEIFWKRGTLLGIPAHVPGSLGHVQPRRFRFSDDFEIGLWDDGLAVSNLREKGWDVTDIAAYGGAIAALPQGKYIVHRPLALNDYPTASGRFFSAARYWWVKQWVIKYALAGAEMGANPRVAATVPQQMVGDDVLDDLLEEMSKAAADGFYIARGGTEITVHEGVAEGSVKAWFELVKYCDAALSKLWLGSTLNVEVGDTGGNRSLGESQADQTMDPRREQSAAQLWSTFQRDLFTFVRDYNPHIFPPSTPLPIGHSVLSEERVEVDALAVKARVVRNDELRISRGLSEVGGEWGEAWATLPDDAPTTVAPITTPTSAQAAPEVGDVPLAARLSPWTLAAIKGGLAATETSTHSPTTTSDSEPSTPSGDRPS